MTAAPNKMTGRLISIAGVSVAAAALAFGLGYDRAALGALAGAPIGMLNFYLTFSASLQGGEGERAPSPVNIYLRSLMRMAISMIALLVALRFGPEFLIGALAGILSETATYTGDAVRLMLKRWR